VASRATRGGTAGVRVDEQRESVEKAATEFREWASITVADKAKR